MTEYICIRKLYEDHGKPNFCNCLKCRDEKEHRAVLEFYRKDMGPGATYNEPFPEKNSKKEEQ